MSKKKPDKTDFLAEGLGFLQDLAVQQEEAAYARRHTDFQKMVEEAPPVEQEEGGEPEIRAEVVLKDKPDTIAAGTGKFKSHFKATAFGRNTSSIYTAEAGSLCPHCKFAILEEVTSFSGKTCEFFIFPISTFLNSRNI